MTGCDGTGAAKRSYSSSEVRGSGQEEVLLPEERWLSWHRRPQRCYCTFSIRRCGGEEIPVQGEEQRLSFSGAPLKRYPTSKVREPK